MNVDIPYIHNFQCLAALSKTVFEILYLDCLSILAASPMWCEAFSVGERMLHTEFLNYTWLILSSNVIMGNWKKINGNEAIEWSVSGHKMVEKLKWTLTFPERNWFARNRWMYWPCWKFSNQTCLFKFELIFWNVKI